ncbi:hypothetical protein P5V97_24370 [Mycobacteroides abscessus subsp. massiliense]|uniref:hypothetical protein n=1 Tax=Mycobacteroides abscessus TaxID=36809 RepID=UPI00266C35B2|nr:hypothetical protein [Mycobacteroides abscessus]MDO2992624.1 hypothetical protein [Mycobacteroides abscessus subsp. massiliense]
MSEIPQERDPRLSKPKMSTTAIIVMIIMTITTAVMVTEFFLLAAYIVYKTGATTGIADIGRAVAQIIAAITNNPPPP